MSTSVPGRASIVILSLDKRPYTERCLTSLLATDYPDLEIVVVDNGSQDGSVAFLRDFRETAVAAGVGFTLIENDDNIGCSTARNQGTEAATGEFVAYCDNDVVLRQRAWLARLIAVLHEHPEAAMVGPKLLYPFPPHAIQCAGAAVTRGGRVQFCGRGEPRDTPAHNVAREVQCLISATCVARRDAVRAVDGWDEVYNPVEFEDIDLCYKLRAAGHTIRYQPGAEIYHFENVTTEGTPKLPNTYLIVKNGMTFKKRWQHMFAQEDGPAEADARWRTDIPTRALDEVGMLDVL